MRFELVPTKMADGQLIFGVRGLDRPRPGLIGWIRRLPSGWTRYGYENDQPPMLRTPDEAVDDLILHDAWEQDTATWPETKAEA
jgi:hypothetical protein